MVIAKFLQHSVAIKRRDSVFPEASDSGLRSAAVCSGQNITVRHALAYRHRGNIIPTFLVSIFSSTLVCSHRRMKVHACFRAVSFPPLLFVQLYGRLRSALISVIVIPENAFEIQCEITVCSEETFYHLCLRTFFV